MIQLLSPKNISARVPNGRMIRWDQAILTWLIPMHGWYVGSLSFSIVYLCALMVLISVPMSSCLLLKSPVIIVCLCRRIMPSKISLDDFLCGQYTVAICICSCPVVTSIECCRFVVGFVVFIGSSVSVSRMKIFRSFILLLMPRMLWWMIFTFYVRLLLYLYLCLIR